MKLLAAIQKDMRILWRDKMGLLMLIAMPVLLVIIVTSIQNSTFNIAGKKRIGLLICNRDSGKLSQDFIHALDTTGMFSFLYLDKTSGVKNIADSMRKNDIVMGIVINASFTSQIAAKAKNNAGKALTSFGLEGDAATASSATENYLDLYYNPAIQQSLKVSMQGAINTTVQVIQGKETLRDLYFSINEKPLPDSLEQQTFANENVIKEIPLSAGNEAVVLNATQHNVPAWTIFAMFFVVMSLGSSLVREKASGSFVRLKTLPTNYFISLLSKQITYLGVTFLQAIIIFCIGVVLFPYIGLPALQLPRDIAGLIVVTLVCGWCAVSYAICIGAFANTQEQANTFGAVSIVILSIMGGLMIPVFIMPGSFRSVMAISPLHWCLQAYYGLFLEGGKLKDVGANILSLLIIAIVLQAIALLRLKQKKLI